MQILAVDANQVNLDRIAAQSQKDRNHALCASSLAQARSLLEQEDIDVVVTNKTLPDGDGFEMMRQALAQTPPSPVIIISSQNTVDAMIEALRLGAVDYIPDPIDAKILKIAMRRAYERRQMHLSAERDKAKENELTFGFLQGASEPMQKIFEQIRHCAPFKTTVLITGESGTGKDLVAKSIHALGSQSQGPFIAINCSAIPRELVESQLFGSEKGAYTGSIARQQGVFEAAHGGTLFLDEIGDLALDAQAKLLRTLEDRQITRLGNTTPIDIEVRLIAATNTNLEKAIAEGRFREDLYYRLNVLQIDMPPLRNRHEDIPLLTRVFLDRFAQENSTKPKAISPEALRQLTAYNWPGNVRELKNLAERLAVTIQSDLIQITDLPPHLQSIQISETAFPTLDLTPFIGIPLEEIEHLIINHTLTYTLGNRTKAAHLLGISLRTLQRKLKEYEQVLLIAD